MAMHADTIVSVATPPGISGVAVLRVSGPAAAVAAARIAGSLPQARRACLRTFVDPRSGETLDRGLVLWFPRPASFTGEDVVEFQVHGGRAVVAAVLQAVLAIEGMRAAEPGEFARRAFENGRLDLAEVEGLADLLAAETESQRRQAMGLFSGRLVGEADDLAQRLVGLLAMVEASIDFPDEGDIASSTLAAAKSGLRNVLGDIEAHLARARQAEIVRDGLTVAIAGRPNAGKSTLLNLLARREVAIVSAIPGTTRDTLEVHLDLGGMAVILVDTAGLRSSSDLVEQEGIKRARARIGAADLVLWLDPQGLPPEAEELDAAGPDAFWLVQSQIDRTVHRAEGVRHRISATDGSGIDGLLAELSAHALSQAGGEPALVVNERHRQIFDAARGALRDALAVDNWDEAPEIVAEALRAALHALARSRGRIGSEAILDVLFSRFCIGK